MVKTCLSRKDFSLLLSIKLKIKVEVIKMLYTAYINLYTAL